MHPHHGVSDLSLNLPPVSELKGPSPSRLDAEMDEQGARNDGIRSSCGHQGLDGLPLFSFWIADLNIPRNVLISVLAYRQFLAAS